MGQAERLGAAGVQTKAESSEEIRDQLRSYLLARQSGRFCVVIVVVVVVTKLYSDYLSLASKVRYLILNCRLGGKSHQPETANSSQHNRESSKNSSERTVIRLSTEPVHICNCCYHHHHSANNSCAQHLIATLDILHPNQSDQSLYLIDPPLSKPGKLLSLTNHNNTTNESSRPRLFP